MHGKIQFKSGLRVLSFLITIAIFGNPVLANNPGSVHSSAADSIDQVIRNMSLREKVGQLFFITVPSHYRNDKSQTFKELSGIVKNYNVAGLSMFGGNAYAAAENIARLQKLSKHPLLVASTMEWGLPMRLSSGTHFPENMALGATRNPGYAYQEGKAVAKEMQALGYHINFAPVMDINNNPDNPIINVRSYGENPEIVSKFGVNFIKGLQSEHVAATAKHFPGHGDTGVDSHLMLPSVDASYKQLKSMELVPFKKAIDAGVKMIMTAHIALPNLPDGNKPATLSPFVENSILRDSLGFKGVIVTDALNMGGIVNGYWPGEAAVDAIKAGADMLLFSPDFKLAYQTVLDAVKDGRISEQRVNESVRRIMKLKQFVHVDKHRYPDMAKINQALEQPETLEMADQMFRKSITLVKDQYRKIPLDAGRLDKVTAIVLTDEDRNGYPGNTFLSGITHRVDNTTVFRIGPDPSDELLNKVNQSIEQSNATVIGTFVQFRDHKGSIGLPEKQADWLEKVFKTNNNIETVGFGNPYLLKYFPDAPSYMLTYSVADASQRAAVEALFGEAPITGKLPITLPSGYKFGHGLQRNIHHNEWVDDLHPERFKKAFDLIKEAIADTSAPGMAVYIARKGKVLAAQGFGHFTYDKSSTKVTRKTMYDLASMTKVTATTPMAMEMYERNLLHLDKPVKSYMPKFSGGLKDSVTIRNLLTHSAGLVPFIKFWTVTDDPSKVMDIIGKKPLIYTPGDSTVYSDLGIITMGKIDAKLGMKPLDQLAHDDLYAPMGMDHTMYNPPAKLKPMIAPTEFDKVYRHRQIHGEVHDENAAFFGGVSGHAGLFSTVDDIGRYAQMLLSHGYFNGKKYFKKSTIDLFTRRQNVVKGSSRALGWDTPSEHHSTYGKYFSNEAFGHTGFTGTSVIIDPKYDIIVVLLSNRVYPTREHRNLYKYRPKIHNAIMEALLSPEELSQAKAK